MRFLLVPTGLTVFATLAAAADGAPKVTFVGHDKVATVIAKGGSLVTQPDLTVTGSHRDKAGQVEIHDKETDVIYMIEGEATFVTGGSVAGQQKTRPGQSVGTDVHGGETHRLTKGDVIVVPAGTPHWVKEVPKSVSYYV